MVQVMTRCTALRPTMAHMFVHRFGSAGDMVLGPHFQVDYRFPHQAPPAGLDLTTVNVACAGYGIRAYLRPFVHLARQGAIYISEYDDTGQSKNLAGRRYLISEMLEPFRDRLLPGPPLNN
jgi:hypothetical protein